MSKLVPVQDLKLNNITYIETALIAKTFAEYIATDIGGILDDEYLRTMWEVFEKHFVIEYKTVTKPKQ